jgi:hypothetical protein
VIEEVQRHWPDLPIYARARDAAHAAHAIPETIEAMVLVGAGVPGEAARRLIEIRRQDEQAMLDENRESLRR